MINSAIKTIGVIGTGVIGSSWALLFLSKGLRVVVTDPSPGAEQRLTTYLQQQWPLMQRTGLHENASLANYHFVTDIFSHINDIDLVQETGPENVDFKKQLFAKLDAKASPDVLLLSSSSGIPASQFVTECKHNPGRIMIGHPFNPPHLIPLVEVVPHPATTDQYTKRAIDFYRSVGKKPILIKKETPGFIANRLQAALYNEAYSLVARGIVSAEDLDTSITAGPGLRWSTTGPFMTNVLAGDGNFRHFMEHIGMATKVWAEDMREHAFDLTPESIDVLDVNVKQWIQNVEMDRLVKERDEVLSELLALKSNASSFQ